MLHNDIDTWRTGTLISMAVGQTAFAILYLTFPWWKTFLGRGLFYKAVMFAVLLDLALLARVFDLLQNDILFVILYIGLSIGIWWQFFAFLRVKRSGLAERGVSASTSDSERANNTSTP